MVVFPAGAVSTAPDKLGLKPAVDARWQPFVSQLIQRSKAAVVPIWFGGQKQPSFPGREPRQLHAAHLADFSRGPVPHRDFFAGRDRRVDSVRRPCRDQGPAGARGRLARHASMRLRGLLLRSRSLPAPPTSCCGRARGVESAESGVAVKI